MRTKSLTEHFPPLSLASALTPVRVVGEFVLTCNRWLLGLIAFSLAIAVNGIHFDISNEDFVNGARALPRPEEWYSSSWGPLLVGRVTGLDSSLHAWNVGYLVATLAALLLAVMLILSRPTPRRRLAVLILAASPLVTVMLFGIGRYDLFMITGSALVALSSRWWLVAFGALIAASSNPEQAVVSAMCLLLVSFAPRFAAKRRHALIFFGIALANWIAVALWFSYFDIESSRADMLPVWLLRSVQGFIEAFPLSLYSWFGPLWLLVLFVAGSLTGKSRWFVIAGMFLLPGALTIATLDGTRVFVSVVAATSLFVVHEQLHTIRHGEIAELFPAPSRSGPDPGNAFALTGVIALMLLLLPSIYYTGYNGYIVPPWDIVRVYFDETVPLWEARVHEIMGTSP